MHQCAKNVSAQPSSSARAAVQQYRAEHFSFLFLLIPSIIFSNFSSLSPSLDVNQTRSHISRLFSPLPTTVRAFIFIERMIQHFLPSSTRIELRQQDTEIPPQARLLIWKRVRSTPTSVRSLPFLSSCFLPGITTWPVIVLVQAGTAVQQHLVQQFGYHQRKLSLPRKTTGPLITKSRTRNLPGIVCPNINGIKSKHESTM